MNRIFILGSCVSRDAFEEVPHCFELAGYLARTSMASIGMPPVTDTEVREKAAALPSAFQKRMIFNDLEKSTSSIINSTAHDVLLVDLIDERFDLVLSEDSFFSLSGELRNSGLELDARPIVKFESETFFTLWLAGFERFLALVDERKVVVNHAFWAERFPDGSDAASLGWIKRNNAVLEKLYKEIDARWNLSSIDYPPSVVVSNPDHRWGVAPYHFTRPFYEHAINSMSMLIFDK